MGQGQPNLAPYAQKTDLVKFAQKSDLAGFAKVDQVQPKGNYIKADELSKFQVAVAGDYAKQTDLDNYAKFNHTHGNYVTTDEIVNYYTIAQSNDKYALLNHTHGNYSLVDHTHGNYSLIDHTHGNYSLVDHVHDIYALKSELTNYAPIKHNHNADYYTKTESNTQFQAKGNYQPAGSYAAANHNHDAAYYTKAQSDAAYKNFAPANHNHDASYYTKAQSDAAYVKSSGNVVLNTPGHAAGSNNASLELRAPSNTNEVSIRFHNWTQLRSYNGGLRVTGGENNNVANFQAWQVEADTIRNTHNKNGLKLQGLTISEDGNLGLNNKQLRLRSAGDINHYISYDNTNALDGVRIQGNQGGVLGTNNKTALKWDNNNNITMYNNLCTNDLCLTPSDILQLKNLVLTTPTFNLLNNNNWINDNTTPTGNSLTKVTDINAASNFPFLWRFTRVGDNKADFYGAAQTVNVSIPVNRTVRFGIWFKKTRSTNTNTSNMIALDITFLDSANKQLKSKQARAPTTPQVDTTWRFASIDDTVPTGTTKIKVKISSQFNETFDFLPNTYLIVV